MEEEEGRGDYFFINTGWWRQVERKAVLTESIVCVRVFGE